jgi:sugar phosphate isomerase/epimerase
MRTTQVRGLLAGIGLCLVAMAVASAAEDGVAKRAAPYPFFAFQDGMVGLAPEQQAKILKELGYDGIEFEGPPRQIPEMLKALDARGLRMFSIYTGANVDPDKPPYDPELKAGIGRLNGRGALISLYVVGGQPSSADFDDRAVTVIREIADMAEPSGLRIALYPHTGMYVARVEDGIRLVKKVDRKNVGVGFNLCHFLKLDHEKNLEQRLAEAMPYLLTVSINGADGGDTRQMQWSRIIQTLDRGSFDVGRMLKTLKRLGFSGPVGLQCYAIPGDPRENLKRSMQAWRSLCRLTAADDEEKGVNQQDRQYGERK